MPFYKTPTFFICLAALVLVTILFAKVEPKANAQRGETRRPLVYVTIDHPAKVKDSLNWDFGFIPIYVTSTCLVCFLVAGLAGVPFRVTRLVLLIVIVTSLFDFSENFVVLHIINTPDRGGWVSAALVLEYLKWVSPITGAVYVVAVLVWRVVSAVRR